MLKKNSPPIGIPVDIDRDHFAKLMTMGKVGIWLFDPSTLGVVIPVISHTIFLSEIENSMLSNKSARITSAKPIHVRRDQQ